MKLKYEFVFQPLGDMYMGVAVGDGAQEFSGMLQLDEVAYDIVSRMTGDITRDALIDQLLEIYDCDRDLIAASVDQIIADLKGRGVLQD